MQAAQEKRHEFDPYNPKKNSRCDGKLGTDGILELTEEFPKANWDLHANERPSFERTM